MTSMKIVAKLSPRVDLWESVGHDTRQRCLILSIDGDFSFSQALSPETARKLMSVLNKHLQAKDEIPDFRRT